jgi:hypothetical protein
MSYKRELEPINEPFNGEKNFISFSNQNRSDTNFEIHLDHAGLNMLTN